jgi:sugar phosphate isomerase/epimerase
MEKPMKPTITGFLDHQGKSTFDEQIALLLKHNLDTICLKSYNNRPIIELSENDFKQIIQTTKDAKIKIGIIDTGIQSYDLYDDKKHKDSLDEFKYMIKVADKLKVTHLYFRLPIFNEVIKEYDAIEKRLEPYIDLAMRNNKKIILFPVKDYKASVYAFILKKVKSNVLSFAFDPVFIMNNNESTTTAYRLLKNRIGIFMARDADHHGLPKLMGYGKTDITEIMKKLFRDNYAGFISVDNQFSETVFDDEPKKVGFFKSIFSGEKKKKNDVLIELSKKIFPNEETKNVTYDDILANQIKILNLLFK